LLAIMSCLIVLTMPVTIEGYQKTGFAPSLDLVVSHQESADVARDGSQDRLSPALMITVGADDETGPLFGALLIR